MSEAQSPIVASLKNRSPHPYSSIALSPSRHHAVAAAKDTLTVISVRPSGLSEIRSLRVSQVSLSCVCLYFSPARLAHRFTAHHVQQFQTPVASADPVARSRSGRNMMDIRDTFGYTKQSQSPQNMSNANVIITDVVWSLPQSGLDEDIAADDASQHDWRTDREADSFLAAAGSNGVFVIWNARHAFLERGASTTMGYPPDTVRSHSSRAVNRLAWHPTGKHPGHLLTASQDGTVKLWERKLAMPRTASDKSQDAQGVRSWFGKQERSRQASSSGRSYSWECTKTFNPKSEAIREVRWSPFHDNSKLRVLR